MYTFSEDLESADSQFGMITKIHSKKITPTMINHIKIVITYL